MPKYISGRSKTPQSALSADRYRYLSVGDAEPNLGDTPSIQGSPNLPAGQQYIVVSFIDRPGERFWIPNQGGIIPGSLSVFEEGTLVGGLSSTTQLDFRGNAITATGVGGTNPGIAVTVTVVPPEIIIQYYSKMVVIFLQILDLLLIMDYLPLVIESL